MQPAKFDYGDAVRVIRTLRNDGTFPGVATGGLLVRRGSIGYVRDVGTFLQDQIIYSVDFINEAIRVGCRQEELQGANDPWIATRFEFRDKVTPRSQLAVNGEIIATPGDAGEVEKVLLNAASEPAYHVRFTSRLLQVNESQLDALDRLT
ncbi:MAG: nitrogen fixation protein NifZ [Gammaproteobacteria bacterium]|nr:nitrogen fixation protein NifZ [Gammaproteobacteria bacterium]